MYVFPSFDVFILFIRFDNTESTCVYITMTCNVRHKHRVTITSTTVAAAASTKPRITKATTKKTHRLEIHQKQIEKKIVHMKITKTTIEWKRNWLHARSGLGTSGNKVGHLILGVKICIKSCHHTWVALTLPASHHGCQCVWVCLWVCVLEILQLSQ